MTAAGASLLLDVGSSAVKALVVGDGGDVLSSCSAPAPPVAARGARRELDARALVRAAEAVAVEAMSASVRRPDDILVSTQMHTAVLTDAGDEPVSPMISWQDNRLLERDGAGRTHLEVLFERGEAIWARSGIARRPGFGGGNLGVWLREQGAGLPRGRVHTVGSYLAAAWGAPFATGVGNAASLGLMDVGARVWSPELAELHGLEGWALPEVVRGNDGVATVTVGGVPLRWRGDVADHQASVLGAGAVARRDLLISLGTAGIAARVAELPSGDVGMDSRPFGERYLLTMSRQPGGAAAASFARTVAALASQVSGQSVAAREVWERASAPVDLPSSAWVSFGEGADGEPELSFGGLREPEAAFAELFGAFVGAYVQAYEACIGRLFGPGERPERLRFNGGMAVNNAAFVEALQRGLRVREVQVPEGDLALRGLARLVGDEDVWKDEAA